MSTQTEKLDRCYLVYATAPNEMRPRETNRAFNDYIADIRRGLVLSHDHFLGKRGGYAVFYVRTAEELARLNDPAPLSGWHLAIHPLTFALSPSGFRAQIDFTLRTYRRTSLQELEAHELPQRRHWWRRTRRDELPEGDREEG
jgi:hypothetical protein